MSWYKDLFNPISRLRDKTLPPVTVAKKPNVESNGSYIAPPAPFPPPPPPPKPIFFNSQPMMFSGSYALTGSVLINEGSGSYLTPEMKEAIRKDRIKKIEKFKKYSLTPEQT